MGTGTFGTVYQVSQVMLLTLLIGKRRGDRGGGGHQEGTPGQKVQKQGASDYEGALPPECDKPETCILHVRV